MTAGRTDMAMPAGTSRMAIRRFHVLRTTAVAAGLLASAGAAFAWSTGARASEGQHQKPAPPSSAPQGPPSEPWQPPGPPPLGNADAFDANRSVAPPPPATPNSQPSKQSDPAASNAPVALTEAQQATVRQIATSDPDVAKLLAADPLAEIKPMVTWSARDARGGTQVLGGELTVVFSHPVAASLAFRYVDYPAMYSAGKDGRLYVTRHVPTDSAGLTGVIVNVDLTKNALVGLAPLPGSDSPPPPPPLFGPEKGY